MTRQRFYFTELLCLRFFAIISKSGYNVQRPMNATTELNSIKETLRSSEIFQGLTGEELDKLLPLCQEQFYEAGAVMFCEGAQCNYVQTLKSGKVALETELTISRSAAERATIDVLSEGSSFCWSALMEPHILSVMFHDLKAPLAAAESYNRLLLDGFVGELSEEQKNIVRRSSKRLSDLLNLISNMIDFY